MKQVSNWSGCLLQVNFNWFCVIFKMPQTSFFHRLGCENAGLCTYGACSNSFDIKAFTCIKQINTFHIYLLCFVDKAVPGVLGKLCVCTAGTVDSGFQVRKTIFTVALISNWKRSPGISTPGDTQCWTGQTPRNLMKIGPALVGSEQTRQPPEVTSSLVFLVFAE